jgi:hypothetical protein
VTNKETALKLVEQMLEKAREEDERHREKATAEGKAADAVGESWMVFHLKTLKGLISCDDEWYTM